MPLAGRLADVRGTRRLFLGALIVFIAGSMLAGRAQSLEELVAGRIVQAVGGGALVPVATAAASHLFAGAARPRALGVIGALTFLGMAVGPFVGAAILGAFHPDEPRGARAALDPSLAVGSRRPGLAVGVLPQRAARARRAGPRLGGERRLGDRTALPSGGRAGRGAVLGRAGDRARGVDAAGEPRRHSWVSTRRPSRSCWRRSRSSPRCWSSLAGCSRATRSSTCGCSSGCRSRRVARLAAHRVRARDRARRRGGLRRSACSTADPTTSAWCSARSRERWPSGRWPRGSSCARAAGGRHPGRPGGGGVRVVADGRLDARDQRHGSRRHARPVRRRVRPDGDATKHGRGRVGGAGGVRGGQRDRDRGADGRHGRRAGHPYSVRLDRHRRPLRPGVRHADGVSAFIPEELRDRPLKDGLVVEALEGWAAGEAARIMVGVVGVAALLTLLAVVARARP